MAEPLLRIDQLSKRFGGVVAADAITLDIPPGEFHAVIGPNGAGKTTLIGLIAGEVAPQQGSVRFEGTDITRLPAHRRSRLGLARSFQITSLFSEFTALDNVALAAQAALARVGLAQRAGVHVAKLSHGEHRQLEIAMALVAEPRLLLLDEPMAGMGPEESARMVAMLRQLKGGMTVLLIEHDMEAVFALADRITVLVYGRVIASGSPAAIRADPDVRRAYLGEHEAATHE